MPTKHYYIEGERICTKIGGGFGLVAPLPPLDTAGTNTISFAAQLWTMVRRGFECAGNKVNDISILPGFSAINNSNNLENYRYYYHPDHLGSSSFISNQSGNVIEHLQYMPYGENFISQRSGRYDTPYKFSGKEKDEETQYSYFGARYYDSDLSIWLSVDPLASKYPSLSPYNYCANNPINIIDPNGMDIDPTALIKDKDHRDAAILFAQTKEGKAFLDKYASAGQKFTYQGKIIYESKEAGEYDKQGINLVYRIGDEDMKSTTDWNFSTKRKEGYQYDIFVDIAKKGFGTNNKVYNIADAITHENFLHVNSIAEDLLDDGSQNYSNLPEFYRQYKEHADHYYISREYIFNPQNKNVQLFPVSGLSVLRQISNSLKLNFSDTQIKSTMWNFSGSLIEVNQKGELKYKK